MESQVSKPRRHSLSYRDAGVNIDAGNALVRAIKPIASKTARPGLLSELGGFGGCFELPTDRYHQPVLVAGADGVGTKLKLAIELNRHDSIGIDLVAMCANDIVVQGAEPLFFLDYLATGQLDTTVATTIIRGIGEGCQQAGMALLGGETAEMPGLYAKADYDLAGFAVGVVERTKLIDGSTVTANDVLVGIASNGPHANGYSLIRKIIATRKVSLQDPFGNRTLGEVLLTPTRIYVRPMLTLMHTVPIHAAAHITGGGLIENLPRILPAEIRAVVDTTTWTHPPIFDWLQENGDIDDDEMYRTFNCGIGMVLFVSKEDQAATLGQLRELGETALVIGHTEQQSGDDRLVLLR
ncbi:MAG: phosphoribosylformylglycinamidine cyclo-ligase [Proteobacteria bacterium]|nr:phosphoribosylformylglycinamidine cyclo-ligase [Pseudomonadota bacterium]